MYKTEREGEGEREGLVMGTTWTWRKQNEDGWQHIPSVRLVFHRLQDLSYRIWQLCGNFNRSKSLSTSSLITCTDIMALLLCYCLSIFFSICASNIHVQYVLHDYEYWLQLLTTFSNFSEVVFIDYWIHFNLYAGVYVTLNL